MEHKESKLIKNMHALWNAVADLQEDLKKGKKKKAEVMLDN